MNRILLLTIAIFLHLNIFANYLEVYRNVGIRIKPVSGSEIIYDAQANQLFPLLDEGKQTNGYYHIQLPENRSGYVYRTMVRLHKGTIPVKLEEPTTATTNDIFGIGQIPLNYYKGTENLTGEDLKKQLHLIISNHKVFTYNEAWDAIAEIDRSPINTDNIILLYTLRPQKAFNRDRGTSYNYANNSYKLIDSWNREHTWPKSHGFSNQSDTAYTDLHHLRPADRSVNSARNTRSFDNSMEIYFDNAGKEETSCYTSSTTWSWEPPDEVKGDIARMLFYMAVRYEGPGYDLELVDSIVDKGNKAPILGNLPTLLQWHHNDPVDNRERTRNHIIYKNYQHNRNPFIDHPHWVESIWK